jgi:nicotinate-nucleotide--dimethylbenzimidazole phosphoribosyltransferase
MIEWLQQPAAAPSAVHRERAQAHQNQLTKPPGSLGRIEQVAIELCALQQRGQPRVDAVAIAIFAADHGVAAEGVSAFPQVVTGEMVKNFSAGGAAITVLARELNAQFQVVNVGTAQALPALPQVLDRRIGAGTANFCNEPAMSAEDCAAALRSGADVVDALPACDLFIGGEMGIANTTAATALACALLQLEPQALAGRGTGVDDTGLQRKVAAIATALRRHRETAASPFGALRCLGGFEIAALAGAYIRCAQRGVPVLVDGFICTAAALAATRLNPSIAPWLLYSHASAERGHRTLIECLQARPLLDLDLRLGEGSGAALAVPLLRLACALHAQMASFASAGVSTGEAGEP